MNKSILLVFAILINSILFGQCPSGDVVLSSQLEVDDFVSNYPNCTTINGVLRITGPVNDISSLDYIERIEDWLSIDNTDLIEISNFNNLAYIDYNINIQDNNSLLSIGGFNNIIQFNNINIDRNIILEEIIGFNSLEIVDESIWFQTNNNLKMINGFEKLREVKEVLSFMTNYNLEVIPDFNNLVYVGKQLQVVNSGLTEISGFNNLDFIGSNIFGGLSIQFNTKLLNIVGFDKLTNLPHILLIRYNDLLTSIHGLSNLKYIGDFLDISDNPNLESLEGLNSLSSVSNPDYNMLPESFKITNNASLTDCSVICELLVSNGVVGTINISNNQLGCDSQTEVEEVCTGSEFDYLNFFTPNNDSINDTWGIEGLINQIYSVNIYDRFGKVIAQLNPQERWDGTYNGILMPSTDYWFQLIIEDGRIFKGHFSLIRRQ